MKESIHKSVKSDSEFIVRGEPNRGYLLASGVASTNPKVIKEIERIRREGGDFATVDWIARQLSNTL